MGSLQGGFKRNEALKNGEEIGNFGWIPYKQREVVGYASVQVPLPQPKITDSRWLSVIFIVSFLQRDLRVGAVLREQNALPYDTWGTDSLTAKSAIDNCRAGRAAKGASPVASTKNTAYPFGYAVFLLSATDRGNRVLSWVHARSDRKRWFERIRKWSARRRSARRADTRWINI